MGVSRDYTEIKAYSYSLGKKDAKGRAMGCIFRTYRVEYVEDDRANCGRSSRHAAGVFFGYRCRQTRDGVEYGPSSTLVDFATPGELEAAVKKIVASKVGGAA